MSSKLIARLIIVTALSVCALTAADSLRVCATVPDLGDLARRIGGAQVDVTVFAQGGDDPHDVEARPSFVLALARADCLVHVGVELEIGWLPAIQRQAGNAALRAGSPGNIDASQAVDLIRPQGPVDRSMGHVHAAGNPHYLCDPIQGWLVAGLLCQRFTALRPAAAEVFAQNLAAFGGELALRLVGEARVRELGAEVVLRQCRSGELALDGVEGWLGRMAPWRGTAVIVDHDQWPYFARRYGVNIVGCIEPLPGIPPGAKHLNTLATQMRTAAVTRVWTSAAYDQRPIAAIAAQTGARIHTLPHQVGAVDGSDDYLSFCAACVEVLCAP